MPNLQIPTTTSVRAFSPMTSLLTRPVAAQPQAAPVRTAAPVHATAPATASKLPFGLTPLTATMTVLAIGLGGFALYKAFEK